MRPLSLLPDMCIRLFFSFLLIANVAWCQQKDAPYVLLISFDGFRYDYVEKYDAPNFKTFIAKGASTEGLIPSFPSKTGPNHYTLITGLYPGHHGLVDNWFYDPDMKKQYTMSDRNSVRDSSFYKGVPLWQLAQQQGIKTASLFWLGSEASICGQLPTYTLPYKKSMPDMDRVNQVVAWLSLPEKDRPHFITAYFSLVDTEGHDFGPESERTKDVVLKADSLVGVLMKSLDKLKLPINVVIVSDHGMVALKQEAATYIVLEDLLDLTDTSMVYVNDGTQAHFYTKNIEEVYEELKKKENHFKVYKRNQLPTQWCYDNPRVGDVLMVADPGHYIRVTKFHPPQTNSHPSVFGTHGFDPALVPQMNGIFYAQGPAIKSGIKIEAIQNIHVYPFIAKLLGLKMGDVDGELRFLAPALR